MKNIMNIKVARKLNHHYIYIYIYGGRKFELLYWALNPIYQQEYVRGGVNVWKCPIGGGHAGKCLKALVREGYPPQT